MGEEGGDAMRIGKRCFVGNLAWRRRAGRRHPAM